MQQRAAAPHRTHLEREVGVVRAVVVGWEGGAVGVVWDPVLGVVGLGCGLPLTYVLPGTPASAAVVIAGALGWVVGGPTAQNGVGDGMSAYRDGA